MTAFLRNTGAVFLRDLGGYFLSPVAYIVLFLFALTNGLMFSFYARYFEGDPRQIMRVIEQMFGFALFWVLPLSPLLTMRLLAEEKRTGSLELLLTAPLTETQTVLGKFFAAQTFYSLIWASLLPLIVILDIRGNPDWGPVLTTYAGLFSLGLLTNALGLLATAGTRNQLIAATFALTGNLLFFLVSMLPNVLPPDPDVKRLFHYLSFTAHFAHEFTRGIIDVRYVVFYAGFCLLFLFFSVRLLEARKWR